MSFTIVVPTLGRASLLQLISSLDASSGPWPDEIVLVDDRPRPHGDVLDTTGVSGWTADRIRVLRSGCRGPAAARNVGWRSAPSDWIAFLDDDVQVTPGWLMQLAIDLESAAPNVAGSQGRVIVPLPPHRRPTDSERGTAGLASARWITADMAYRRAVLAQVDGFDERFRRAFREDADLALRVTAGGYRLTVGQRHSVHPVRPSGWWTSVRQQRGNADDALMRRLHGAGWQHRAGAPIGRRRANALISVAGAAALSAAAGQRWRIAGMAVMGWAAGTAQFAMLRIAPGPRDPREVARMITTSLAIPPVAVWHWARGRLRHRRAMPWAHVTASRVGAVLLDRDGTIVTDVPYNGEPDHVRPLPGAKAALNRLRAAGIPVGVITNQSGIARGLLTLDQVRAVNARIERELGPFDVWQVCPHDEQDGCHCRKPEPGMVQQAAARLGVPVEQCVVIGDIGIDVQAAAAAGAVGLLVPTPATRADEIRAARTVYRNLDDAVDALLSRSPARPAT